ncbi:pantoate---beta-alanine ligase (AMP-forming) [Synchytrium microbalum]|uniref:Pantoate--beta-alanine ligase n=1 Tax=Synchytrium microbalum TaxID=1806994 RepID=A0A507C6W4_9FUNG|nr:pantoate---beta-alanine ligase (AMP-forming) [Synchytrium microbalum]TPX35251.1 pantoate---beta-alanine ligase (AMP-forming) [Synchytrium microbalum]
MATRTRVVWAPVRSTIRHIGTGAGVNPAKQASAAAATAIAPQPSHIYHTPSIQDEILLVNTLRDYRILRNRWFREGKTVGFVPTMGALHDGHASLAERARRENDIVVSSIFVNPAQFAPTEDLAKYPRTLERDLAILDEAGVDVAFVPSVEEMYPAGIVLDVGAQAGSFVEVKGKSHQMEGMIRPHFFRGVATVVTKLFNMMQPTRSYFGQKDIQQCIVIKSMIRDLHIPTDIVIAPTIREHDGLAMSSRNRYLSAEERSVAPILYRALAEARDVYNRGGSRREDIILAAEKVIEADPRAKLEYLSLANPSSLREEEKVTRREGAILSGAVRIGKTRIIDNLLLGTSVERLSSQN